MNLKDIQKIPLKEKKFLLQEICLIYRKLKATEKMGSNKNQGTRISDIRKRINVINNKTVSMFETILTLLKSEHAEIIEVEFVNAEKRNWDEWRWSKTTYYRLREEAIDEFLYLLFT